MLDLRDHAGPCWTICATLTRAIELRTIQPKNKNVGDFESARPHYRFFQGAAPPSRGSGAAPCERPDFLKETKSQWERVHSGFSLPARNPYDIYTTVLLHTHLPHLFEYLLCSKIPKFDCLPNNNNKENRLGY
jgi:hypothetical protein